VTPWTYCARYAATTVAWEDQVARRRHAGSGSEVLNQLSDVTAASDANDANDANEREITVLLASPRSFCAGVQRAVGVVESALAHAAGPVYVRKQIVHNVRVVADLAARGAVFVNELDEIPDPPPQGAVVVFSAHGVSPAVRAEADRRGLHVIDATCPLVSKVHSEAARFAGRGDMIVLIGHAGHEEVEGTLGVAPAATVLVQSVEDVAALDLPAGRPVSYLTQTTLSVDETASVIEALRARYPNLREPPSDDICYATTNRQLALRAVIDDADLLLVIGSRNSSNSQRLVELARRGGVAAHLIDGPDDIDPAWLDNVSVIALTAGASAPMVLVREVVDALGAYGSVRVIERKVTNETMRFALPRTSKNR
jgi:4-hydroxy-3-methylbut-2-enyl diphosphate reductase